MPDPGKTFTVVVAGGGIPGCIAAAEAARLGYKTLLVEEREFLGHELTATGKTWLGCRGLGGELAVLAGAEKKRLLAEQLDWGNRVLFAAVPGALGFRENRCCGLLAGTPYGLMRIQGRYFFDASPEGVLGAFLNGPYHAPPGSRGIYCFEVEKIDWLFERYIPVPASFGLEDNRVILHPQVKDRTVSVELRYDTARWDSPVLLSYEICKYLRKEAEPFREACLSELPSEARVETGEFEIPAGFRGLERIPPLPQDFDTADIEKARVLIRDLVGRALAEKAPAPELPEWYSAGGRRLEGKDLKTVPWNSGGMEIELERVSFDFRHIGRSYTAPAVVAGLGTSGFTAAQALLEEGVQPFLIDRMRMIGGTSTAGYVSGYWHGYQDGINRIRDAETEKISLEISGAPAKTGLTAGSVYQHLVLARLGAKPRLGAVLWGLEITGNRVTGIAAADREGLFFVDTKLVIDGTGEAAAVFLSGLPYEYGDPRTGITQTASLWGRDSWSKRNFRDGRYASDLDSVCSDTYSDLLRGICLGHSGNSDVNFSELLTVRESRRIEGDARLTMKDIFEERIPPDCIAVSQTPLDSHGFISNVFNRLGLSVCEEELKARIPYRSLLPRNIEGLLVVGKCFSGSRDAVCVCRMNADLRNLGFAAGLAASMALKASGSLRAVDIPALQQKLKSLRILPDWAWLPPPPPDFTLSSGRINTIRVLLSDPETAVPALLEEAAKGKNREELEKALAWFGNPAALDACAKCLAENPGDPACSILLARGGREKDKPVLREALEKIGPGGPVAYPPSAYGQSRLDMWKVPNFSLLLNAALACGR
ncbi:MAG: FAD-dependent oxidoreductase, partial [Treponema sp.]|nr:FAD-dependent oxidoreductase [Treponema sp.]